MIIEKVDLGLSLGLNFPAAGEQKRSCNSSSLHLNLMPAFISSSSSSSPFNFQHKTLNWADSLPSSSDRNKAEAFRVETRSFVKMIDVNRTPATAAEAEEEAGVSSPYSTISSISGKRSERDLVVEDHDAERASSRGISDEDDGENCRKKLRLSKDQSAVLEETFKEHSTLNPKQKLALAKKLGLRPRQVEVWFQNRRARTKLKQTEVDCEFLKRWCENLTDENRRLEKELQELRALKLSPHFYMQMPPPTTLTMCPSCERVSGPPPSSSTAAAPEKLPDHHRHHHRQTLPFNPWATMATPIVHRPLDILRPRS